MIRARRAQLARLASIGQQLGYALFALAVVIFVIGFVAGFNAILVAVVVAALVVGSGVLLPAIILDYAVKAAEREERERR